MGTTNSKITFFLLLSTLIVCSSVQGATTNIFQTFRRELMIETIQRLVFDPSISTYSSPALLTVASGIPVNTPVPAASPRNTPTPVTNPINTPVPATAPVNTPAPVPNPINTPTRAPSPVTTPSTNTPVPVGAVPSVAPSPTTTAGQVWCVANSGMRRVTLQNALDFACGHGADCSAIQPGAVCYNPDTLQNHASYAFNSYYHNSPVQTSCDFEGLATITTVNPSYGSCIYSSTTPNTTNPTPTPTTTSPPPTPTVSGAPQSDPNASPPGSGGGGGTTVVPNSPQSMSSGLQPFISWIIVVTSIVTWRIVKTVEYC